MQLVVGVAVLHHGRVLAARRCRPPETAGGWELPGGKVHPGEEPAATAVREVHEELDCTVEVTGWLEPEVPIRDGLVLRVATAVLADGEPVPRADEHDAVRWLAPGQLDDVAWLPADRPFTDPLRKALAAPD